MRAREEENVSGDIYHIVDLKVEFSLCVLSYSVIPWTAARQASLSFTNSQSLLKLVCVKSVIPSNHLILCHPLFHWPTSFPSIRVFSIESPLHFRWPKYGSFSFSISPSSEYSGLISFRIDWFALLAVKGLSRVFFLHHSLKASVLGYSAFFMVPLSHPYMTTRKNHSFDCTDLCLQSNGSAF